jgi:4-azaleucine resistance transporter AzlC
VTLQALESMTEQNSYAKGVRSGLVAMSPLLVAVVPFSTALGVAANTAGFNPIETIMMSMFVFAGAAQMAAISLYAGGAGLLTIAMTTLLINLRHIVYGLSLDRHLPSSVRPSRPALAFLLVDESYVLSMSNQARHARTDAFFVGASLGMYLSFVLFTGVGAVFASLVPALESLGLDFIFPLAFIALLLPLLTGIKQIVIAAVSGILALVLLQIFDPGIAILLAILAGATVGAAWKDAR